MYDPLDALGSPTATPRGRSPSAPSEPRPGVSPLRSPTVLSLRHAPRSWSTRPPARPRTIGPHARTQTSAVAHVRSTPAVALRCRELLCSRGPQADSVRSEHAISGENRWAGPSRHRQHLQCQLVPGLKREGLGHSGLLATRPVLGPVLRKIKTYINNRMFFSGDVTHVDAHLAVLNLAQAAAPLLGDPHRLGPFLGKPRGIKDDDAVGLAQLLADLGCQRPEHRLMVPGNLTKKLLNPLPLLIQKVRDPFTGLAFQLRHQPGDIFGRMTPVFGRGEVLDERLDKCLQPREHTPKQVGGDMCLTQHLIQTRLESSFHDIPLRANLRYGRDCRKEG